MKRSTKIFIALSIVAAAAIIGVSCARVGKVTIHDIKISRIVPQSLTSLSGTMQLQVQNDGDAFDIKTADATVYLDDKELCSIEFEPVKVDADTTEWIDVFPTARISQDISMLQLMSIIKNHDVNRFSVTYSVSAKVGMFNRKKTETKVPLAKFLKQ